MKVGDLVKDGWENVFIILKVIKPDEDDKYGRVYVFVTKSGACKLRSWSLPPGRQFSYGYTSAKHCFTILSRA